MATRSSQFGSKLKKENSQHSAFWRLCCILFVWFVTKTLQIKVAFFACLLKSLHKAVFNLQFVFLSFHHFLGEKHRGPISLSIVNIILYPTSLKRKNHNWMWMDAGSCAEFRNVNCNEMWPWLCKIEKVQFTKCFH